jgi:hypothetical protein
VTHVEELFVKSLEDLANKIASGDGYETLRASLILRQLLLDDYPLVDQVNRERRLRLRFEVGVDAHGERVRQIPGVLFWSTQDTFDPDVPPLGNNLTRLVCTRAQFLSRPVLLTDGRTYSVADIISFEANVMGGVHAGSAKEDKDRALLTVGHLFGIEGLRAPLRQLQAIGRVVLKGLQPLRDQINMERQQ